MASKLFPPNGLTQPSPPSLPLSPFRPHLSRPTHTTTATHLDTSIPAATEPQIPAMSNSSPTLSSSPSDRRNSVEWGTSLPHLPPSPIPYPTPSPPALPYHMPQPQPNPPVPQLTPPRRLQSPPLPLPKAQGLHLRRAQLARRPRRQQLQHQVPREAQGAVEVVLRLHLQGQQQQGVGLPPAGLVGLVEGRLARVVGRRAGPHLSVVAVDVCIGDGWQGCEGRVV